MMHTRMRTLIGASALATLAGGGVIRSVQSEAEAGAEITRMIADLTTKIENRFKAQAKDWDDFKAENNAAKDGLDKQKVEKISTELSELGTEMATLQKVIGALRTYGEDIVAGGFSGKSSTPEQAAYREAFSGRNGYLRRGSSNGLHDLAVKASTSLAADSDPDGGFTVTPEIEKSISRVLPTMCAMRDLAQVMTIGSAAYKKFVSVGGATAGWVDQRETRGATTTPTLVGMVFTAREMYSEPTAPQGLLDDSFINIEEWLANEVAITFGEQEGLAFISGVDGAKQPVGLLSYGTIADANYAWGKLGFIGTGAADFGAANQGDTFNTIVYAIKKGYRVNGSWLMNRKNIGKIRSFKDAYGQYLWQPGLQAGTPATLLGYPVADDDNMPDTGANLFPVAFGDFKRGYLIADRIGVRVLRDPLTSKGNVIFYTTKRLGGGVQNFEAIKLMKCA